MKKKVLAGLVISLFCLTVGFSGCSLKDSAGQALAQLEQQWEEEAARALREQEDTPDTVTQDTQEETTPETEKGSQEAEKDSQNVTKGKQRTPKISPRELLKKAEEDTSKEASEVAPETIQETASEGETKPYTFEDSAAGHFAYDSLSEPEQVWYRNINRILGQMQENEALAETGLENGLTEKNIDKIFQCVLNDHPEYFYVEGYTYTSYTRLDKLIKIEFSGTYSMDMEAAKVRREEIEAAAGQILEGISADASEYARVKYVYETLVCNTDYDLAAPDNQNVYSVFVNKRSVCQGYAKAVQYLLNRLGVECTMAMGTVDTGEGHAWNLVKVDGSYYYVDATWGDASYRVDGEEEGQLTQKKPEINYDYLCVTTSQLLRTHTLGGVVPMPVCEALDANYYVREGAYFTRYDTVQLETVFQTAKELGKSDVTLKCADLEVYQVMDNALIEEQGIFEYLDSPDGVIAFAQNEKQLSMTFWMTNE